MMLRNETFNGQQRNVKMVEVITHPSGTSRKGLYWPVLPYSVFIKMDLSVMYCIEQRQVSQRTLLSRRYCNISVLSRWSYAFLMSENAATLLCHLEVSCSTSLTSSRMLLTVDRPQRKHVIEFSLARSSQLSLRLFLRGHLFLWIWECFIRSNVPLFSSVKCSLHRPLDSMSHRYMVTYINTMTTFVPSALLQHALSHST